MIGRPSLYKTPSNVGRIAAVARGLRAAEEHAGRGEVERAKATRHQPLGGSAAPRTIFSRSVRAGRVRCLLYGDATVAFGGRDD